MKLSEIVTGGYYAVGPSMGAICQKVKVVEKGVHYPVYPDHAWGRKHDSRYPNGVLVVPILKDGSEGERTQAISARRIQATWEQYEQHLESLRKRRKEKDQAYDRAKQKMAELAELADLRTIDWYVFPTHDGAGMKLTERAIDSIIAKLKGES